ncbi:MAG: 16S rRNA (cytidine(1402)-2'-O)-methyltransferase [Desulfotalea sp.]
MTETGILYLVPTPIGNLEDITLRALRILGEVDLIAAEDTRHSKKLMNHFEITTPLISYYREKEMQRSEELIAKLQEGMNIAIITDAGTPAISDPGAVVVKKAHAAGIKVVPLPGPSAVTTALSASGITDSGFLFLGFAPSKKSQRKKFLSSIKDSDYAVVLYESPHRIESLLDDCLEILGDRMVFWARELTKAFEDLQREKLSVLCNKTKKTKGEFVVIIEPEEKEEISAESVEEMLIWYRDNSGLSLKDATKKLSSDLGLSRSQLYSQALELWKDK